MAGIDAARLRDLLREDLARRLAGDRWTVVAGEPVALATLMRSLEDGFAATAEVLGMSRVPDRPPVSVTSLVVGVSYEPLRRLARSLGEEEFGLTALEEPVGGLEDDAPDWRINVSTEADVGAAADELAILVGRYGVAFAEQYADFDTLLAAHRADDPDEFGVMVPLLLAAAGRVDEARDALARYRPHDYEDVGLFEVTLVGKLTAWLDGGADRAP